MREFNGLNEMGYEVKVAPHPKEHLIQLKLKVGLFDVGQSETKQIQHVDLKKKDRKGSFVKDEASLSLHPHSLVPFIIDEGVLQLFITFIHLP